MAEFTTDPWTPATGREWLQAPCRRIRFVGEASGSRLRTADRYSRPTHQRLQPSIYVTRTHVRIGDRRIGPNEPCYIIAEAGINHNGDLALARQLVDAAVDAGVDAIKFQKRKLSEVYQESILAEPRLGEQALQ